MIEEQNINQLPKDWKVLKLSEVGKIISGGTPSTAIPEYWNGNINWISPADLTGYKKKYISKGAKSITSDGLKNSSARLMPKGSVLFSSRAPIGYVAVASNELATNQGFKSIIPNEDTDSYYLYYFLKSAKRMADSVASGTTFKEISLSKFADLKIPLPPKPTQQAIVSKIEELFSELDKGIEQLKTAQQQLKTYRQSVLKWAFEGKLTNENVNDGELPKGWKLAKISELCKVVRGGSPRPAGDPKYYDGDIPFLKVADLTNGDGMFLTKYKYTIKQAGLHKTRKIKPHTLLLSNSGATLGVPKICMIDATMNDGIAAFLDLDERSNHYLYYFWLSKTRELRNINMGAAQPNLNTDLIKDYDVPYCSFEEQNNIVQEIESRLSVADKMEESIYQSLQQAEALRQSILKKAFEGRLVATDTMETIKQDEKIIPFERKVLAGKIIHLLHADHHFGLTKFQKIFYLVENFAEVPYETNFIQERAGPYDKEFTLAFRKEMQEKDWVQEEQKRSITKFIPGENIGSLISSYATYFREKGSQIVFVIKQLKDKSTHDAELIATLYAVWNNRLIKRKPIIIALLVEDFFNWSPKKKEEFHEEEVIAMYNWMKEIKLIPKGFGKVIELANA